MVSQYVYIAFIDNGFESGNPNHLDYIIGVYTSHVIAELALHEHGFTEKDSEGNLWRGRECGWIEKHGVHDYYV